MHLPEPERAAPAPARRSVSVVVPTYREAENLPSLIERIAAVRSQHGLELELLIMDDDSRDGSAELCASRPEPWVTLVTRTSERGLSAAVLDGLRRARGDVLVCMDADLSHPPEALPALLAKLDEGADFVIGSRYVDGGSTSDDWGFLRWINSRVATLLARPLTAARDPMAGFFALRRATFSAGRELNPVGYKIGLELIVKCACERVVEVPIHFEDRVHGESKLTLRQQLLYLKHLRRLYTFKYGVWSQLMQFLTVGALGTVVNLGALTALIPLAPTRTAVALAIFVSMCFNFVLNRRFSFSIVRGPWVRQLVTYLTASSLGALINYFTTLFVLARFHGVAPQLAALGGIALGTGFNFVSSRYLVFRSAHVRAPDERLRQRPLSEGGLAGRVGLAALIAVVLLGAGLRFTNLGGKVYWFDETVTSLRVSGLWEEDVYQELGRRPELHRAGDFERFQSPQPGTSWQSVVRGLAEEEPQHAPLYYVLSRLWAEAFGGSPAVLRGLSALLSVLGFPCAFWLALELFGSRSLAWLTLALFAVSPFEVLQAQTAREYGFWVTGILLSSAALLRALRLRTRGAWLGYGLCTALAMQTFAFTALVIAGQGVYVLLREHVWSTERRSFLHGAVVRFAVAAGAAGLSILPWLAALQSADQVKSATSWTESARPLGDMFKAYAAGLLRLVFDVNAQSGATRPELALAGVLTLLLAVLLGVGARALWLHRKADHGLLLLLIIAGNALPLVLHDLFLHGQLSAVPRLLAPAYAAVHFVLARALLRLYPEERRLPAAPVIAAGLLALGIFSDVQSARAEVWWNKDPNNVNAEVAQVIRAAPEPVLVSDGWAEDMFSLAYLLDPGTPVFGQFLAYIGHPAPPQSNVELPIAAREVFYFNARPYTIGAFAGWLEQQKSLGRAQPLVTRGDHTVLWKVRVE